MNDDASDQILTISIQSVSFNFFGLYKYKLKCRIFQNIQIIRTEKLIYPSKTMPSFAIRFSLHVFTRKQIRTSNHTEIK